MTGSIATPTNSVHHTKAYQNDQADGADHTMSSQCHVSHLLHVSLSHVHLSKAMRRLNQILSHAEAQKTEAWDMHATCDMHWLLDFKSGPPASHAAESMRALIRL